MQFNLPKWMKDLKLGLMNMQRVIVAIILRETKTRFGKNKLGYLWALIEPSAYIALLIFIRKSLHATIPFGENLYLFILTGILVYRIFISVAGRATNAISANQSLLTYPLVKPIDTISARIILEVLTMLVVISVFFIMLSVFSESKIIHSPHIFFEAIIAIMFLSASVGVFNAVLSILVPAWERIWGLLKFPLLVLSGIFYIPKSMPPLLQQILSWNPVLNCVEWIRFGSYLDYDPILSRSYVIWFAIISLTFGLTIEKIYRNKLVQS